MTANLQPDRVTTLRSASGAAGLLVMAVGSLVLIGWTVDVPRLKSIFPSLVPMNPATALAFILAGASLGLLGMKQAGPRARRFGKACAFIVALVGLIKLGGYLFGLEIGFDQVLFREKLGAQGFYPNRMAPNTALNFFLLGSALLLLDLQTPRRGRRPAQYLTLLATLVSLLALTGYAYGLKPLYGFSSYIPMALNTALGFAVLCAGVLFARPDQGWMAVITSDNAGGMLARRLLPAVIGIPMILGWLRLAGERAGLYGTEFGVSLTALMSIILLAIVVWWSSAALNRTDAERKRAEEERDRYYHLSPDMFCIAGFDGYFKQLNPAWETTLGWTVAELCSKPYLEFVHPEDRTPTTTEARNLSGGRATLTFENRYRCQDGSYKWLQWNAIPHSDRQLIYAAARDITDRKQDEESLKNYAAQLESVNKELEAFSYSVSHDLRAPLRHIDGYSQILLEDCSDKLDQEGRKYLRQVREASQQMARLIDDLLNLSRLTRAEIRRGTVDLSRMADAAAAELKNTQPDRMVEFVIEDGLITEGDARLLRVVLDNLLGNAWKYTGKRSDARIEFGRTNHENRATYFVRDNGAGFEMAYVHKLFGAFQRLHSVSEFPGTGIGLATVQRIVHRHGGQVWAAGAVDQGATFYFTL
ncbi:MAG TPA: ATP-binding protein [Nitrospiria bacterium]